MVVGGRINIQAGGATLSPYDGVTGLYQGGLLADLLVVGNQVTFTASNAGAIIWTVTLTAVTQATIWTLTWTVNSALGVFTNGDIVTFVLPVADEDVIADAVAVELNEEFADEFSDENVTAVRTRKPWYEADDLETLKVAVVPLTIKRERLSRAHRQFEYGIGIDLQRMVEPTDSAKLTELSLLAEQIQEYFDDAHTLTVLAPNWIYLEANREDVYSLELLHAGRIWETFIELVVRGKKT